MKYLKYWYIVFDFINIKKLIIQNDSQYFEIHKFVLNNVFSYNKDNIYKYNYNCLIYLNNYKDQKLIFDLYSYLNKLNNYNYIYTNVYSSLKKLNLYHDLLSNWFFSKTKILLNKSKLNNYFFYVNFFRICQNSIFIKKNNYLLQNNILKKTFKNYAKKFFYKCRLYKKFKYNSNQLIFSFCNKRKLKKNKLFDKTKQVIFIEKNKNNKKLLKKLKNYFYSDNNVTRLKKIKNKRDGYIRFFIKSKIYAFNLKKKKNFITKISNFSKLKKKINFFNKLNKKNLNNVSIFESFIKSLFNKKKKLKMKKLIKIKIKKKNFIYRSINKIFLKIKFNIKKKNFIFKKKFSRYNYIFFNYKNYKLLNEIKIRKYLKKRKFNNLKSRSKFKRKKEFRKLQISKQISMKFMRKKKNYNTSKNRVILIKNTLSNHFMFNYHILIKNKLYYNNWFYRI